ncbi:hypothetical protein HGRIS_013885 [Hohenbuehelia grisea]|uniref:C2 domain-containing protein n=1 Tax=Hohenbuehelia grisea TaxID=104357 RepID=A0ABR3IX51_9AGAR
MPGGRRNPLSVSKIVERVRDTVHNAKSNAHDMASLTKTLAEQNLIRYVDLQIQFIGASELPKMDVVGSADPYFVANLDDKISFVSTVKRDTLTPIWNELWRVKNVPSHADLIVEVMDKDEGAPHDDFIGKFKTSLHPGAKELEIEGTIFGRKRGTFWLKIESTPSVHPQPAKHPYTFDGPIRYSQHLSPTVGLFTNLNDKRLYSTWKVYPRGVPFFLDAHSAQHWNKDYKAAQSIFQGPTSIAVRSSIQAGHRLLYARTSGNAFGVIDGPEEVLNLLKGGLSRPPNESASNNKDDNCNNPAPAESQQSSFAHRIKPAVYTYIISAEDDSLRFSETGAAFFVDFASKHALHANCAQSVRYSGEFHPRPVGGWAAFNDSTPDEAVDWEIVIDNNSGTYAPDPMILPDLKALLEYNFGFNAVPESSTNASAWDQRPHGHTRSSSNTSGQASSASNLHKFKGLRVVALDRQDPELESSREACRAYALKYRGVKQDELQPHAGDGEETLSHKVSILPSLSNGSGESGPSA